VIGRRRRTADTGTAPKVIDSSEETYLQGLPVDDPRLALALEQVQRGLTQQQGSLDNLRARAGTLVAASSLVSSFFGSSVLREPLSGLAVQGMVILAFAALGAVIVSAVVIIWPYEWKWGIDGYSLLGDYVVGDRPSSLNAMRYSLTFYVQQDLLENEKQLNQLWKALQFSVVAIALQIAFWSVALVL